MREYSKLDCAKTHFKEAIWLFFGERDPIVVHTVISAALGILNDLLRGHNKDSESCFRSEAFVKKYIKNKKAWFNALNEVANFSKHADKDPAVSIRFDPEINDIALIEAWLCFVELSENHASMYIFTFRLWVMENHPDFFSYMPDCYRNFLKEDDLDYSSKVEVFSYMKRCDERGDWPAW